MDKYYLKSDIIYKNNKRFIVGYKLYYNDKIIKELDENSSRKITHKIKEYNINYIDNSDYIIIDNIDFLKAFVGIPSKKVSHINKYPKANIIIASTVLSLVLGAFGLMAIKKGSSKNNPKPEAGTELLTDDNNEISTNEIDDNIENTTEETNYSTISDKEISTEISSTENNNEISNEYNSSNLIEYSYADLENRLFLDDIRERFGETIHKYSKIYGIDENLITAIIAQENPHLWSGGRAAGLMQVERVAWHGVTVTDIDGSDLYIDCDLMDDIDNYYDYSIHVGCYIFWFTYNKVNEDNEDNQFNYKLTDAEVLAVAISSYNKSVYSVEPCLEYTNNLQETDAEIELIDWGDTQYREKVLSSLDDGYTITMMTRNGEIKNIAVDNLYYGNPIKK